MSNLKTAPQDGDVEAFLASVQDPVRRQDALLLLQMMRDITGEEPRLWGPTIVGFGSYHYRYDSGREGDWFITGFSPRKQSMTVYIMNGFRRYDELLEQLGKHSTGKSCLYIRRLEQVDEQVLRTLIAESYAYMKAKYPNE